MRREPPSRCAPATPGQRRNSECASASIARSPAGAARRGEATALCIALSLDPTPGYRPPGAETACPSSAHLQPFTAAPSGRPPCAALHRVSRDCGGEEYL